MTFLHYINHLFHKCFNLFGLTLKVRLYNTFAFIIFTFFFLGFFIAASLYQHDAYSSFVSFVVAGGCAGLVEVLLLHPLDLLKTRLQIQGGNYSGVIDCFNQTWKNEGISAFYKGILLPLLAEIPKCATKFFTFEQYKKAFVFDSIPIWVCISCAGLCSGLTEAFIACPFEVVKVRMQADKTASFEKRESTLSVAREVIRKHGYGTEGLYRGLDATLIKSGIWNMIYFGLYYNLKQYIPVGGNANGNFLLRLGLGFLAGSIASIVSIPFDVAKSRIQGPQPSTGRMYHGCFQTIDLIVKREGYVALCCGIIPKVIRLGPGGAIMLVVYENVHDFLQKHL